MKAKTYSEKLRSPLWQKKRLQIMKRDKFECKLCGDCNSLLNVHHKKYTSIEPCDEKNENLITLCETCHKLIEAYKKAGYTLDKAFKIKSKKDTIFYAIKSNDSFDFWIIDENNTYNPFRIHPEMIDSFLKFIK